MSVDTLPGKAFASMSAVPPEASGPRAAQTDGSPQAAAVRPASAVHVVATEEVPAPADPQEPAGGDPRALVAARVAAAVALLVSAALHLRGALSLGLAGGVLAQSHLVLLVALPAAVIGLLLLGRDSRVWLVAVTVAGLDEPVWLLTKAVSALADLSVVVLWLIRQVAPPPE